MSMKIQETHRQRRACVYIRQSTMGQVRHHQESTERQYALKDKAVTLGGLPDQIQILDGDLGMSGAQSSGREDFKAMVASVSLGEVGAIFALEASRLARSSLDWHRLIEICAFSGTLVIDEDGCYEPADFNDRLLLGLKAQMAQAELHTIRERLQGGKLNKARKGALRFPLPVGLCPGEEDQIILDPDTEVQGAVRLLFETFRQAGTAYAVVHAFMKKGMRFPKRAVGGAWAGKLIWGHLSHGRVLGGLKNPSYAGVYVYGRHRQVKEITSDGEIRSRSKLMPIDEWLTTIYDHHPGYIGWEEFLRNQELLEKNRTHGEEAILSGADCVAMRLPRPAVSRFAAICWIRRFRPGFWKCWNPRRLKSPMRRSANSRSETTRCRSNGRCGSRARSMRPISPSGAMRKWIHRTGSLRQPSRNAGTRRWSPSRH